MIIPSVTAKPSSVVFFINPVLVFDLRAEVLDVFVLDVVVLGVVVLDVVVLDVVVLDVVM